MSRAEAGAVVRQLHTLFSVGTLGGLSDQQLLERFITRRDEAELAFEAILARHGPMVLGVCRRVLRDPHDVEDAFQATFLILVRKAGSIRVDDSLGRWLHGVTRRVAVRARANALRRQAREEPHGELPEASAEDDGPDDLRAVIDEEVSRLPEKYRAAVVLCYLEGLTHERAADRLRCPVGTVKSRLSRACEHLKRQLARRGVTPSASAGLLAILFTANRTRAAVPASLERSTIHVALHATSRAAPAGTVPASVAALAEGVIHSMLITKLKTSAIALLAVVILASGVGSYAFDEPKRIVLYGDADGGIRVVSREHPSTPSQFAEDIENLLRTARKQQESGEKNAAAVTVRTIGQVAAQWERSLVPTDQARPAGENQNSQSTSYRKHILRTSPYAVPTVVAESPDGVVITQTPEINTKAPGFYARFNPPDKPADTEARLKALETKLDQILKRLDSPPTRYEAK